MSAKVVAVQLTKAKRAPMQRVRHAKAIENQGLEGDRHARPDQRRSVLLMRQEDLDRFGLEPGDVREQVTVSGFDLYGPASGTRLRVGSAVLELGGPCAPCAFIDGIRPGLRQAIEGFRGRFATVVVGGAFGVGDAVLPDNPA